MLGEWWRQFPKTYKVILAMITCGAMTDIYFYLLKGV